jgi:hypothetical protein
LPDWAGYPPGDDAPLDWALSMPQLEQRKRPTATTLFEDVMKMWTECGIPFGGPCCDGARGNYQG